MAKFLDYLNILIEQKNLDYEQAKDLIDTVFAGDVPEPQIAAFLTAMRIKTPCVQELAGFAASLRAHANKINCKKTSLLDIVGTGGAKLKTFNISTASAFIAAGAGATVAKHGNHAITSKCGSADVLTELGINVNASPETIANCIDNANIGFMFAPMFHPAMKYVQPTRKTLRFRTVFNILGPLANPADAQHMLLGIADPTLLLQMTKTLQILGVKHALVVHSRGLDEISTMNSTKICELNNNNITERKIHPSEFNIPVADFEDLKGGDAKTNAKIISDILTKKEKGPKRDIAVLNAAAALVAADIATGFNDAIKKANDAIDNGNAKIALDKMIQISNS